MRWTLLFPFFSLVATTVALAEAPLHQRIDALIDAGAADLPKAALSDDAEFVRRVYLDFAGIIPTASETQAFLADKNKDKRAKLIQQLLDAPGYGPTMRDRFHVQLMERRGDHEMWLAWLGEAFAKNKPWNQMAREMIRADFRDEPNRGAAFFYTKRLEKYGTNPTDYSGLTRDVGRLFLGMDMQCAECHNHLLIDDYNQIDFQGLFAGFSKMKLLRGDYPAVEEQIMLKKQEYASVFVGKQREVGPKVPGLEEVELVSFEKDEQYVQAPDRATKTPGVPKFSPLERFSEQIPTAPTFDGNIVNRVWFLMMGRGLVNPMDQFHSENPASHPELLDLLAAEFAKNGYDFKWLFRELALTKTYQRSSRLPEGTEPVQEDRFVVARERRVSAEQLLASTLRALNVDPAKAPMENVESEEEDGEEFVGLTERFLDAFATEPREPEREFSPGLKAALFAMNDVEVLKLIAREDALPAKLAGEPDNAKIAEALFHNIFSRPPSPDESADVAAFLDSFEGERAAAITEVAWAMLSSTEFVVNH
ncbi:MAG: hypothetical protein ACI8UO_003294 [Verrucomicrobiales bacterium]|jgi:hypothetical protein